MLSHFGEAMKARREQSGTSRAALAKQMGIRPGVLASIEKCASLPNKRMLSTICGHLKVSEEELLLGAGLVPCWLEDLLRKRPRDMLDVFSSRFGSSGFENQNDQNSVEPCPDRVLETKLGKLYQADCVVFLRSLDDESTDLVFADPPFNLNKDYGHNISDSLSECHYLAWCCLWLREVIRILKPGGSLFLYNLPKWNVRLAAWLTQYLEFRHWIAVDIKFSLPISGRLYPSHYSLLYFAKGPRVRTFNPPRLPIETCRHCGGELRDYGGYKDRMNPRGVNITDVWTDLSPVRHARFKRRTANELPLKLLDRVLDIAAREGDLVVDPFGGSGTTYIAAELKGRRWLGSEIEDCRPIINRFEHLDREKENLQEIRKKINLLFTPDSLALRRRNGHDTSKYRFSGSRVIETSVQPHC